MSAKTQQGSAASRVFVVVAVSAAVIVAALAAVLVLDAERSERNEAEEVTRAVASALASLPEVAESLSAPDPSEALQPLAADVMAQTGLDFVTIMTPDGIRVSHRDPAEIGRHYLGTIPSTPSVFTEEFTGPACP